MHRFQFLVLFLLSYSLTSAQKISTLIHDDSKNFEAIHWHPNGTILSIDYYNGNIYQIYLDGTVETLVTGLSNPAGGGFDASGQFYFSELATGKVFLLEADQSISLIGSGLSQPTGIYPLPNSDTLLVGNYQSNNAVKLNQVDGSITPWVAGNGISGPDMIIPYGDHFLISNFNNTKIFKANISGDVELFATVPESGYLGYIVEAGDFVYTAAYGARKIYRIGQNGETKWMAGTGSNGHIDGEAAEASFSTPNGICSNVEGDSLLITDGPRIRVLSGLQSVSTVPSASMIPIQLSPNPVQDILQIPPTLFVEDSLHWSITSMDGQTLLEGTFVYQDNGKIDLKHLPAGSYNITIRRQHQRVSTQTFIKS